MIPVLTTERLTLRAPRLSDWDAYAAFRMSDRTIPIGGPDTRARAWHHFTSVSGQWHLRGYGRWIVADRATDAPLGLVGLFHPIEWPEPELAWSVFAEGEGRGFAFEAARAARTHAYDTLGWTTLISLIDPANTRSVALGHRMGAVPDGVFHHETHGAMDVWRHPAPEAFA